MYIFANPIIGRSLSFSNLRLSDKALSYLVRRDTRTEEIFLTDDYTLVADIIGMDFELTLPDGNDTARFFDFVTESKYFRPEKFHGDAIAHLRDEVRMFAEYEKYLNTFGIDNIIAMRKANNIVFERIQLERLHALFPFLQEQIDMNVYWLENQSQIIDLARKKFNGKRILERYPDFHKPNLELVFDEVGASFPSTKLRFLYIKDTDVEVLFERFVNKYLTNETSNA